MEMDMNRSFVRSTLDGGHRTSAYKIVCRQCGKTDKVSAASLSGTLPPEVSAKKFRQRGWAVGNRLGDDLCNICVAANKIGRKQPSATVTPITFNLADLGKLYENHMAEEAPQTDAVPEFTTAQETPVEKFFTVKEAVDANFASMYRIYENIRNGRLKCVKNEVGAFVIAESDLKSFFSKKLTLKLKPVPDPIVNEPAPIVVEPQPLLNDGVNEMNFDPKIPQEMTKEDRRIIFAEIDMHYLDETRGYEAQYDDKRVAEGLKVPEAWVRTIREDNFGPERGEAINDEIAKMAAAKEDLEKSITAMRDLWEEINKSLDAFVVRHNDLSNEAKKSREAATAMMVKIDFITRK
jgi:hypothetical protein